MKGEKIAKEVMINCNGFYLLYHTNGQMHVNMIINAPASEIINKRNASVANLNHFVQDIRHFMFEQIHIDLHILAATLFANTAASLCKLY